MQLVINTFGASLRKEGERFIVQTREKKFPVSAHKVQSILITTGAHFSTDAIELASEHNIDVVFLDKYGDPYGRVWQAKMGSTALIRRRQIEVAGGGDGISFVLEWSKTKLRNQIEFLEELKRRRTDKASRFDGPLTTIHDGLRKVDQISGTIDEQRGTLMGLEGSAGRAYFNCLSGLMPDGFRFNGRSRHPAQDEFNAMLNYGYGVLYSLVEKACILAGLDPFVGFLHTDNYNKKSLVFDLIEPFRILAERATVLIFTGRRARKEFFEPVPGGMGLTSEGKAELITQLNQRLNRTVRYPVQGNRRKRRNIKHRDIIQHEAHALANALLGKRDIPRVVETKEIFADDT